MILPGLVLTNALLFRCFLFVANSAIAAWLLPSCRLLVP